jgi:hypothetical protein
MHGLTYIKYLKIILYIHCNGNFKYHVRSHISIICKIDVHINSHKSCFLYVSEDELQQLVYKKFSFPYEKKYLLLNPLPVNVENMVSSE